MAQANNSLPSAGQGVDELSSVKRALFEIRRLRAELDASRRGHAEPVAIIGMAVRLPGG